MANPYGFDDDEWGQPFIDRINSANPDANPDLPYVNSGSTGGNIMGVETIGPGRSLTPAQYSAQYDAAISKWGKDATDDYLARNPGDVNRIDEAFRDDGNKEGNNNGGGGSSVAQEWNNSSQSNWFSPWFEEFRANQEKERQENKAKSDALYETLMGRANKTLEINRNDPIISGQVAAYRANQDRSSRNYLADLAEREGPYANLTGETRLASERVGSATGAFEANLLAEELKDERDRIERALQAAAGMLSADQTRNLSERLKTIDTALGEQSLALQARGLGNQMDIARMGNDLGLRQLGLTEWDRMMMYDLMQRGLWQ